MTLLQDDTQNGVCDRHEGGGGHPMMRCKGTRGVMLHPKMARRKKQCVSVGGAKEE